MRLLLAIILVCITTTEIGGAPKAIFNQKNSELGQELPEIIKQSFATLIEQELGISPTEFLHELKSLFTDVVRVIQEGLEQLENASIMPVPQDQDNSHVGNPKEAISQMLNICKLILKDLNSVLIMTPKSQPASFDPISDLVCSLLRKSLERFVEDMKSVLEESNRLVICTQNALKELAIGAKPEDARILNEVADKHLYVARQLITVELRRLSNLLNRRLAANRWL